jgi:hypothetical protein
VHSSKLEHNRNIVKVIRNYRSRISG